MWNRLVAKVPIVDEVRRIHKATGMKNLQLSKWRFREPVFVCFPIRMGLQRCSGWMQRKHSSYSDCEKSYREREAQSLLKTPHGNIQENLLPAGKIMSPWKSGRFVDWMQVPTLLWKSFGCGRDPGYGRKSMTPMWAICSARIKTSNGKCS